MNRSINRDTFRAAMLLGRIGIFTLCLALVCASMAQSQPVLQTEQSQQTDQPQAQKREPGGSGENAAPSDQEGRHSRAENKKQNSRDEACGPLCALIGWPREFVEWVERNEHFLVAFSTVIIGAFTLVLAVVTGFLYRATRDLVEGAERTAERQLRAYVHVAEVKVIDDDNLITYYMEIRNFGQTPAHNVSLRYGIALKDYPLTAVLDLPKDLKSISAVVPPQVAIHVNFTPPQPLGPNRRNRLSQRTAAIYVFGTITYDDVFQKRRIAEFRYQYGGVDGPSETGALEISEEGNKAT
jgi:hypothetical protein